MTVHATGARSAALVAASGNSRAAISGSNLKARALAGAAIFLALAAAAPMASAQSAGSTPAAGSGESQATLVGELVVTATKRDERLRDVPEAITAISGAALEAVGPVANTADLIGSVPGARFNNLGNPLLSEVSVRGSGTQRATGADSSVGLYSNGVYIGFSGNGGRNFAPIDYFDVERVEALEGPQGALYGRNAEYGVVNIISVRPSFSNSGSVDDVYTFETRQNKASAIVNYALDDHWAIRVGAEGIKQSKGFVYNPTRDTYYDVTEGYVVRGQLRYAAGPLDVDLLAQRQRERVPSFYSAQVIAPVNTTTGYPGNPNYPLGSYQDPRVLPHNGIDYARQTIDNIVLSVNYDLGWAKLTSTSSFREIGTVQRIDADYIDLATEIKAQSLGERGAYPFAQRDDYADTKTWYEDIHLAGAPLYEGRLSWLAGLELLSQPQNATISQTGNPCATVQAPNMVVGRAACTGTPTQPVCVPILPGSTCPAVVSPYGSFTTNTGSYKSWAPYVSVTYELGAGFTLGGDLRYTHDRKTATNAVRQLYTTLPYPFLSGGVIPDSDYSLSDGNVTYTATLSYKLPESVGGLLYAKTGTGYRVGGFNLATSPPLLKPPYPAGITSAPNYAPITPNYGPETSQSYEAGFKGKITKRAYLALAAYWQVTDGALAGVGDGCLATNACLAGNTNYTVNAGTVHGYGFEAQLSSRWDVFGGVLTVDTSGSNQSAKYRSNPATGPNGEKLNGLPLVGTQIAQNPRWLADATANYQREITTDLRGFMNLHYHGQWGGIQDPTVNASGSYHMDDFQNLDLRTGVDFRSFELALIVRNLTDETHNLAQFQAAGTNTITKAQVPVPSQIRLSFPRTFQVELKYKW
jgi:iron complex outermembrane receptor protein